MSKKFMRSGTFATIKNDVEILNQSIYKYISHLNRASEYRQNENNCDNMNSYIVIGVDERTIQPGIYKKLEEELLGRLALPGKSEGFCSYVPSSSIFLH